MNAGLSFAVGADARIPDVAQPAIDNPPAMHAIAVIRARFAYTIRSVIVIDGMNLLS